MTQSLAFPDVSTRLGARKGARRDFAKMHEELELALVFIAEKGTDTYEEYAPKYPQFQSRHPLAESISYGHMTTLSRIAKTFQDLPERNGKSGLRRLLASLTVTEAKELITLALTQAERIAILEMVEDGLVTHKNSDLQVVVRQVKNGRPLNNITRDLMGALPTAPTNIVAAFPVAATEYADLREWVRRMDMVAAGVEEMTQFALSQIKQFRAELRSSTIRRI